MLADDDRSDNAVAQQAPGSHARRVLFVVLIGALVLLAWRLSDVFLLMFGAIIIAVALRSGAAPLQRMLRLSPRLAVGVVVVVSFVVVFIGSWLIGDRLAVQAANLQQRLASRDAGTRRRRRCTCSAARPHRPRTR